MADQKRGGAAALDLTQGTIWKLMVRFFFPILLGSLFQQLYNTADAIVVGQFVGSSALAAVGGSAGTISNLLIGFFTGLASGSAVVIAQRRGAGDEDGVGEGIHTAVALSLVGGLLLTGVGLLCTPFMLRLLHTPQDTMTGSTQYLTVYFCGMIPMLVYNMGAGILRALGDSKRPLYILAGACVLNIGMDLLFVVVFRMREAGAAAATVASQLASAIAVLVLLARSKGPERLVLRRIRLHAACVKRMLFIGFPTGIQSVMYNISNLIIQAKINLFGTTTVAAWAALGKVDAFFWNMIGALGVTVLTFVSQNFGARKGERMRRGVRTGLALSFGMTTLFILAVLSTGRFLFRMFTGDEAVITEAVRIMYYYVPFFLTYVTIEVLSSALRGTGDTLVPMLITCVCICALRIVWIYSMLPLFPSIITVSFSYPVSWTITSVLFLVYYKKSRRMREALGMR